ncbi:MAG: sugar ABC transporter substrate-binding protein [Thermus sp.]|uniref:ABC transporter substrate-binding protein n=1 Tax=Thermus sp. TaxID=275 RepID=UPI00332B06F5
MKEKLWTRRKVFKLGLIPLAAGPLRALAQGSGELIYNSYMGDPVPRAFDQKMVARFKQKYPGIRVQHTIVAHEDFKQAIRTYLIASRPPDVLTWFAGNRMRFFASRGLLADITDLWQKEGLEKVINPALHEACKYNGRYYFLPTGYYWWAVYYRRDIFERLNLKPPATWEEFLGVCERLKEAGITPLTTGTRFRWPAAAWFDYLNMRINGPKFHIELTDGLVPYTDERVRRVFDYWKVLLDKGYFIANPAAYDWHEGVALMAQGKAAMYLMGAFIRESYPRERWEELDFFRFPIIDPKVPVGEDAPTDGFFVPARARNLQNAKLFLAYAASREFAEAMIKELNSISARTDIPMNLYSDYFQKGIREVLSRANYTAQFYDRDTHPEMAERGMNGFVQFMANPGQIGSILQALEADRKRIFAQEK